MPIDQPDVIEAEVDDTKADAPPPGDTPPSAPPEGRGRPRRLRIVAVVVVIGLVLAAVGAWVAWSTTDLPPIPKLSSTTQIKYVDNSPLATFTTENRVPVSLDEVPKHVQQAVVAAQDPDFEKSHGFLSGSTRALRYLVAGSSGKESITEQYVRNAVSTNVGRSGSVRRAVYAAKLEQTMSKDDILIGYLNAIYYGRGASGIEAAAQAYFGKDVDTLTVEEGAVLAALIDDPSRSDPFGNPDAARTRWNSVLDAMVSAGYLDRAARAQMQFPKVAAQVRPQYSAWRTGSSGVLGQRIESELKQIGFSEQDINTGGLTVQTTISPQVQKAVVQAANTHVKDKDTEAAVVVLDPRSGAVRAYYGGERGYGNFDQASTLGAHPAAATFQPIVLATSVKNGYSIDSLWNGVSGQKFEDRPKPLDNSSSCGPRCSLTTATVQSVESVFWAATLKNGAKNVAQDAKRAGYKTLDKDQTDKANVDGSLALGRYRVSALDQATAYATFAADGVQRQPYFVATVIDADGKTVLFDHAANVAQPTKAWDQATSRDVSYVLQQSYAADRSLQIGRPAAAKSGGQQYGSSSDAWVVGYTPQLVTAVWAGKGESTTIPDAERVNGKINVRGSGVPGAIWRDVMTSSLKATEVEAFGKPVHAGDKRGNA
ncbi:transglycosylase domain-containing protein [Cryptosporangium sp. NPDC048952]|uniref:transglycosylase domain-containing protein n=1 Tax=Cryptosporangium sp. NPDC048952 TaxID=3363961 RepID=UPI00371AA70A